MSKIIVLHGTPGSGKTTHALRLKEQLPHHVEHLSIGNHLRGIKLGQVDSRHKAAIDKQAQELEKSAPLDHEVVNAVVFEFIERCPTSAYVLVDGFPRFVEQLPFFFTAVAQNNHEYLGVVHFDISPATSVSRLTNRGGRPGEQVVTEEFAAWRVSEYQTYAVPAIGLLGMNVMSVSIDAELPVEQVWETFWTHMRALIAPDE